MTTLNRPPRPTFNRKLAILARVAATLPRGSETNNGISARA